MHRIVELPAGPATEWSARDRTFIVKHELRLRLASGVLSYEAIAVAPYEKVYPLWQKSSAEGASFVARAGDRVVAEISLSNGWNGYAHIENLFVAREFRRQGLARELVERAVAWAESRNLAGVMLETQSNNVPACQLYESCGFSLKGFDSSLYRGLDRHSQEVALFWYRQA
jgi:streptothricin acetyltransferase